MRSTSIFVLAALLLMASSAQAGPNTREIVDASEILDKIARGESVDYEGVIIEGNLNLNGVKAGLKLSNYGGMKLSIYR